MRALSIGIVALAVLLASSAFLLAAPAVKAAPSTRVFNLHGDIDQGWGFTSTTITQPGPTIYVEQGDTVTLRLYAVDGIAHNWTIDFNDNSRVDSGEPFSPNFSSSTAPTTFTFTVPTGRVGTWTYRCGIHPSTMTGLIVILSPPTFNLYGSVGTPSGWGNTSTSITNPGPTLVVNQGAAVSLDLYATDGIDHTFYVDWNNNGVFDSATETQSLVFNSSAVPLRFNFTAGQAGTFTFYCGIHGASMRGTLVVRATTTPPTGGLDYTVYAAIIVVIVIVAIAATLLMRRKPRAPPEQPPQQSS